jgi:hypothetical protein
MDRRMLIIGKTKIWNIVERTTKLGRRDRNRAAIRTSSACMDDVYMR